MLRRTATLLGLICLVVPSFLVLATPAAAAPAPTTPLFPRSIDAYARSETESGCDPTTKPGAAEVVRILRATYGSWPGTNVTRACSPSNSGHEEGRAIDWMTNGRDAAQRDLAESFIAWLLAPDRYGNHHAMARRLGVSYLIWDSKKFYLWNTGAGWTEYSNCLSVRTGPEYDNTCHRNHVHVSLSWAGANAQTTWYTQQGETRTTCPAAPPVASTQPSGGDRLGYVPVAPSRVLDTRDGHVHPEGCLLGARNRVDVEVAGRGGVPSSGVSAVALNLTAVEPRDTTWLSAYPTGSVWPGTSSLNVSKGAVTAGLVTVPVGSNGRVSLLNGGGTTDVLVDIVGYYPSDGSGSRYTPAPASRVMDETRGGRSYATVATGAPGGTTGAVVNATLENPAGSGYASLLSGPAGWAPTTSTVNAASGETAANRAFAGVSAGDMTVYNSVPSRTVIDVTGWFGPTGTGYTPVPPARVADSRDGLGGVTRIQGAQPVGVQLGGRGGVPAGVRTVAITLTGVGSDAPAYMRVWEPGTTMPGTSDLNLFPGQDRANMVIAPVDAAGRTNVMLSHGSADVVVDVLGYLY